MTSADPPAVLLPVGRPARPIGPAVGIAAVAAAVTALTAGVDMIGGAAVGNTVSHAFLAFVLVAAIGVFIGNTGILSFGHLAFAAVGAYVSAWLTLPPAIKGQILPNLPDWLAATHLPFLVALPIAALVSALFGAVTGAFISRLGGAAAAIATLGLLIITNSVIVGAVDFTRGAQAIYAVPKAVGIWTAAIAAIGIYAFARLWRDSPAGLLARAAREDEHAARSIGIDVVRSRWIAWTLSAGLAGAAGSLFAHQIGVFSAKEFYFAQTFAALVMLIVGGMGSVSGALAGATLVTVVVEALRRLEEGTTLLGVALPQMYGLTDIGLSVAVLIALYRRGGGLLGTREIDHFLKPQSPPHGSVATVAAAWPGRRPGGADRVSVRGLSKQYGGVVALAGIDLDLNRGEIVGLIGPNGSGKSTLLACLAGTQGKSGGSVAIGGRDVSRLAPERIARAGLARTFQNIRLFGELSVAENVEAAVIASGGTSRRKDASDEAARILAALSLGPLIDRPARTLAYGQQRRLEVARALATRPDFLLLDEPAAGMNDEETEALARFLAELRDRTGVGILVVEHDLPMILGLCDRIVVLGKGGVIADGTPAMIRAHPEVVRVYLGRGRRDKAAAAPQTETE